MRVLAMLFVIGSGSAVWAQGINVENRVGPNNTHFNLELPASSYLYESDTTCTVSYHYDFKVYLNGVLKYSDSFDVINPSSPTYYSNDVSFSTWTLHVGDVIKFYSVAKIIGSTTRDSDNLYADCVDNVSFAPDHPIEETTAMAPSAIDDKRRFEELLG